MDANRFIVAILAAIATPGCDDSVTIGEPGAPPAVPGPPSTLFISDYGANAIFRYDGPSGVFRGVFAAGAAQRVDRPAAVQLGPGGLYAAGFGRGDIARYDALSGELRDIFYWDTRFLEEPVALAFRGDDLIAIGNDTGNAVVLGPDGRQRATFGRPIMRAPHDAVIAPDGALVVATEHNLSRGTAIQVWDIDRGALLRELGTLDELANATGLELLPDGTLLACDYERGRVVRFDLATGAALGTYLDDLTAPLKLALGPDGDLYVLDAIGLHRFDPATGAERALVVAAGDGHLERPVAFRFVTETALRASH